MNNPKSRYIIIAIVVIGAICFILSFFAPSFVPGAKSMNEPLSAAQLIVMYSLEGAGVGLILIGLAIAVAKGRKSGAPVQADQKSSSNLRPRRRMAVLVSLGSIIAVGLIILVVVNPGKPEPKPAVDPSILSAVSTVAFGQGIPAAKAYQPEGPGLHQVVILSTAGKPYENWNNGLPPEWAPKSVGDLELVAWIGPEREIKLGSQPYTVNGKNSVIATAYRFEIDIELREALTGKTIATTTMSGSTPGFPFTVYVAASAKETRIDGSHVVYPSLEEWLCPYISAQKNWTLLRASDGSSGYEGCFSTDGRSMAVNSVYKIDFLQVFDGALQNTLYTSGGDLSDIALSRDWEFAAAGVQNGTVRVYRNPNETPLFTLEGSGDFTQFALSPDGKLLAAGSGTDGKEVQVWNVPDGTLQRTLAGHKDKIIGLTFSPDGQMLASVGDLKDKTVRLWNVADGSLIRSFGTYGYVVNRAGFSPDGQMIAMAGEKDGQCVQVWRISDGTLLNTLTGGYGSQSTYATFSPDGKLLASYSHAGTVRIWNLQDGKLQRSLFITESPSVFGRAVAFSPDGQLLSSDNMLWQLK